MKSITITFNKHLGKEDNRALLTFDDDKQVGIKLPGSHSELKSKTFLELERLAIEQSKTC